MAASDQSKFLPFRRQRNQTSNVSSCSHTPSNSWMAAWIVRKPRSAATRAPTRRFAASCMHRPVSATSNGCTENEFCLTLGDAVPCHTVRDRVLDVCKSGQDARDEPADLVQDNVRGVPRGGTCAGCPEPRQRALQVQHTCTADIFPFLTKVCASHAHRRTISEQVQGAIGHLLGRSTWA